MSDIKLKVILNKGRHGILMQKLAKIAEEAEKFIESFADDVSLNKIEWIADNFKNGSLSFNVNYVGNESEGTILFAQKALDHLTDPKTKPEALDFGVSQKTFLHFARMAHPLDADDSIGIGVPNNKGKFVTRTLTKERASQIEREVNRVTEQYAGFQGSINALFKENNSCWLKDYVSNKRIVCYFKPHLYSKIWKYLETRDVLVNVEGWVTIRNGELEHLRIEDINETAEYQEGDIDKFFGCDSSFSGDVTTEQHLDALRGEELNEH